jgi:transcriptional regulator with XRE-family HTH domain
MIKIRILESIKDYIRRTGNKMNVSKLANIMVEDYDHKMKVVTMQNYLQRSMTGDKELSLQMVIHLSEILGVSVLFLIGKTETPENTNELIKNIDKLATELKEETSSLQELTSKK